MRNRRSLLCNPSIHTPQDCLFTKRYGTLSEPDPTSTDEVALLIMTGVCLNTHRPKKAEAQPSDAAASSSEKAPVKGAHARRRLGIEDRYG